jgi:DNA-binding NarL/FixJ family response regulator
VPRQVSQAVEPILDHLPVARASEELLQTFIAAGLVKPNEEGKVETLAERLARKTTESENAGKDLTPKQVEVMEFVALGLTNKEIARNLDVSPSHAVLPDRMEAPYG